METLRILRSPEGCPWDREQTPHSMRACLLEETYELLEAIDENDAEHVKEELGDIALIVGMLSLMYQEEKHFAIDDVLKSVTEKLIRRHPHVFGDTQVKDSEEVLKNWENIKSNIEGRGSKNNSILDDIPLTFPPIRRAMKLQKRISNKGFDWSSKEDNPQKILEECKKNIQDAEKMNQEAEIGALFFSLINYSRHLGIDPELALQGSNRKFEKRFRLMEKKMNQDNIPMSPEHMNDYWDSVKEDL